MERQRRHRDSTRGFVGHGTGLHGRRSETTPRFVTVRDGQKRVLTDGDAVAIKKVFCKKEPPKQQCPACKQWIKDRWWKKHKDTIQGEGATLKCQFSAGVPILKRRNDRRKADWMARKAAERQIGMEGTDAA